MSGKPSYALMRALQLIAQGTTPYAAAQQLGIHPGTIYRSAHYKRWKASIGKWVVLTYTEVDGWVNCWTVDGVPQVFDTEDEARAELDAFLADVRAAAKRGDMDAPYRKSDYKVVRIAAPTPRKL